MGNVITETTYSVEVEERDCTGAKLVKSESGPSVVKSGFVEPPSSSCLFRTQSSPPIGTPPLSLQLRKMSAPRTTIPSARPRRGWSAQPGARYELTVHPAIGSALAETASKTLPVSRSEMDANQRLLSAS